MKTIEVFLSLLRYKFLIPMIVFALKFNDKLPPVIEGSPGKKWPPYIVYAPQRRKPHREGQRNFCGKNMRCARSQQKIPDLLLWRRRGLINARSLLCDTSIRNLYIGNYENYSDIVRERHRFFHTVNSQVIPGINNVCFSYGSWMGFNES